MGQWIKGRSVSQLVCLGLLGSLCLLFPFVSDSYFSPLQHIFIDSHVVQCLKQATINYPPPWYESRGVEKSTGNHTKLTTKRWNQNEGVSTPITVLPDSPHPSFPQAHTQPCSRWETAPWILRVTFQTVTSG